MFSHNLLYNIFTNKYIDLLFFLLKNASKYIIILVYEKTYILWLNLEEDIMFEKVREIIAEQLSVDDIDSITPETNLLEDLNADSLDAVEIIMNIEEEFDMKIPDEDIDQVRTINDIISYIEARA